jgi:hypothetical protein
MPARREEARTLSEDVLGDEAGRALQLRGEEKKNVADRCGGAFLLPPLGDGKLHASK